MAQRPGNFGFSSYSLIPPAIKMLIGLNVGVFILNSLVLPVLNYQGDDLGNWFFRFFALMPPGSDFFYPYWQLITYQFMHGGITHLFFNMLALWMFGSELEQIWGSSRFVIYYIISGIGGGLLHLAIEAGAPTVGASGAIMGVLIGYGMTFPNRPVMMFPLFIPIPAKIFVIIYALIDLYSGISAAGDGVAHFAHLGGALTGFLMIKFGDRFGIYDAVQRASRSIRSSTKEHDHVGRPVVDVRFRDLSPNPASVQQRGVFHGGSFFHKGEYVTEETVNTILEKISASGYDALDQREKDILMEISRRLS